MTGSGAATLPRDELAFWVMFALSAGVLLCAGWMAWTHREKS